MKAEIIAKLVLIDKTHGKSPRWRPRKYEKSIRGDIKETQTLTKRIVSLSEGSRKCQDWEDPKLTTQLL